MGSGFLIAIWKSVLVGCPALATVCRAPEDPLLILHLQADVIPIGESTDTGIETPCHLTPLKGMSKWIWGCNPTVEL